MSRVRAILSLLLFLSSASLWAQSDDATLINITTLTQLDAIRYDLNGDGVVSFTTAASLTGSPMFSNRAAVVAVMGDTSAYAEAFTSGDFYATAAATTAETGAVAASTTYYYKLSSMATSPYTGYELMNNLDFEDANGDGAADDKSIWAEGATAAGVSGAVAEGWAPIGYFNTLTFIDHAPYTATFDGRGHTISNLYIDRSGTNGVGLFGVLRPGSNLRNLGIEGGSVTGSGGVGGLVGNNRGTISACYATGDATGTSWVGGLVGENDGTISACYATGDATGSGFNIGGLVGLNLGPISACYATGAASGDSLVGGLVGQNRRPISACYATGDASGNSLVGGLVGGNDGPISACYATGDASGNSLVGGLVGTNSGPISACYATGNASGASNVGGLVGSGTATNSYFDSSVSNRPASDSHAKTTTELQTPTAYGTSTDIYANWNIDVDNADTDDDPATGTDDPWDFGTDMQYPALQVDFDRDGTASVAEFGNQPRTVLFRVSSFTPTSGVVGATVAIRGRLFSATATDNAVVFLGAEGDEADNQQWQPSLLRLLLH